MSDEEYITGSVGTLIKRRAEEKARRYIDDESEAPDDADVQEGPQGGLYYDTDSLGTGDGGSGGSDVESLVEDPTALESVWENGWDESTEGRGVLDEVDISFDEFAERVGDKEEELGGLADTATAAGIVVEELTDQTDTSSNEETDGDAEEGDSSSGSSPADSTLWEDELVTNYGEGDTVTVETEQQGAITGRIEEHEWIEEFGELFLIGEDGSEYSIPVEDIEGLE